MTVIIKLKDTHSLSSLGYHMHNSDRSRRIALGKAMALYGSSYVIKKLNVIRIYNKKTHPELANIALQDILYVQRRRNAMTVAQREKNLAITRTKVPH